MAYLENPSTVGFASGLEGMGKGKANWGNCGLMGWKSEGVVVFLIYTTTICLFSKKTKKTKTNKQYHFFFVANFSGGDGGGVIANQITVYHSSTSDHSPILHEYRMAPALDKDRSSPQRKPQPCPLYEKANDSHPA